MPYRYISADNHLQIEYAPKDTFTKRLPAHFKEQTPRVEETANGTRWVVEGRPVTPAADGNDREFLNKRFTNLGVEIPGDKLAAHPDVLLEHMDLSDTYAGVFYGGATRKWAFKDAELEKAVYRAYSDYVMEINSVARDRLIVLPWLNARHPETCAPEIFRLAKLGAKAVEWSVNDAGVPVYSTEWEPLWAAAEETGIVICSHVGDKAGTPYPPNEYGQSLAHFSQVPFNPMGKFIAQFVFSGMFERYPRLHVSIAECRIGWLPFLFQWMDRCYTDRLPDSIVPLEELPTHYVKRNMSFTFEEDYVGTTMLAFPEMVIADTAIWGGDYPHPQGTWPDITPSLDNMFKHLDQETKHEVLFGRAQRIFNIDGPAEDAIDLTEAAHAKLRKAGSRRDRFGGRVSAGVGEVV
jgi:predicted TIM-barrel fold metal-dependent hydrolase